MCVNFQFIWKQKSFGSFLCESYTKGIHKCMTTIANQSFVRINVTY
jgi:hypothetical protein